MMRSTRLPLGGVMLSGKKLTSVSKSCVRWAYVWSTSEKPEAHFTCSMEKVSRIASASVYVFFWPCVMSQKWCFSVIQAVILPNNLTIEEFL